MTPPLANVTNLNGAAIGVINNNSAKIEAEFEKVFYKDGSVNMDGPLDMDSNRIINLPRAVSDSSPVTLAQLREEKKGDPGIPGLPGVGGNTFLTLASMKNLSPLLYASAVLADGVNPPSTYAFVAGNFTGKVDESSIVALNFLPVTAGALVRQTSAEITSLVDETGAVPLTLKARNRGTLNVLEFIPESLHASILSRTPNPSKAAGIALSGYIQTAINAACAKRRTLVIPAGLYNIAPTEAFLAEAGLVQRCFAIRSNLHIEAELGASFRIVDGVSTDAAPVFMSMFATNEQVSNLSWRGLEMDMNGDNNPISPNRNNTSLPHNGYVLWNQAMIFVSGTPSGVAAKATNVVIEYCRFVNTPGVSCVVLAQTNTPGASLGAYWTIRNNFFGGLGYDSRDHSSIFAWATNVTCVYNCFVNPSQIGATTGGGVAAYEVHGSHQTFSDNYVENFYQGMWIDTNQTARTEHIIVENNRLINMKAYGIQTYGLAAVTTHPRKVKITKNFVQLDNNTHPGVDLKGGIALLSPYTMADFDIYDNTIVATGTTVGSSAFIVSNSDVTAQSHTRIRIHHNYAFATTIGATLQTNAVAGLGDIEITDNHWFNLTPAGSFTFPQGVSFAGGPMAIDRLTILRNTCIDDRTVPQCAWGVRLEGTAKVLHVDGNISQNMSQSAYVESGFTATNRYGSFEVTFAFNPGGAVALGATSAIVEIAVPGARFGDKVLYGFSANLAGGRVDGFVARNDVVGVYLENVAGANPLTVAAGTGYITLIKRTNQNFA